MQLRALGVRAEKIIHKASLIPVKGEVGKFWGCVGPHWEAYALVANCTITGKEESIVHDKVDILTQLGDVEVSWGLLPRPAVALVSIGYKENVLSTNTKLLSKAY
jgi:hypothetical protein